MDNRLSPREQAVKAALDAVRDRCDAGGRREADPIGLVHRYTDSADRELVALVAACVAFGNVKTIRNKLSDLLARLGPRPSALCEDRRALGARLRGWKHRVFLGDDIARLLHGARMLQRSHGSLGDLFEHHLRERGTLRAGLAAWCDALRAAGRLRHGGPRRGPTHLLPDPRGASSCKRLLLFLRWMVRPADGIDLGLWRVDASKLVVPLDVHVHRLARNLGLTSRRDASWRTAEDVTRSLARFDPSDPTKYDFSLCHLGMLQGCPARRDRVKCEGCPVMSVCLHWSATPARRRSSKDFW
jgi:uncharacterized protein (TIGR02757 family)